MNAERRRTCVNGVDGAGKIAECSRNNFLGRQIAAVGAAVAARTQLVAGVNLLQRAGLGIFKLHRVGWVAANDSGTRGVNNSVPASHRQGDSPSGCIHGTGQPIHSTLLPVLQILLIPRLQIGSFHHDHRGGGEREIVL